MSDQRLQPAVVSYVTDAIELIASTRAGLEALHSTHAESIETLNQEHAESTRRAESEAVVAMEQAQADSALLLQTTQAKTSATLDRLESEYGSRRQEIMDESESIRTHAAKQADEAKWLAESMYEAALTEPEKALRHAEAELTDAQRRSSTLLGRIRQVAPKLDAEPESNPGPELPDPGLIDTLLNDAQSLVDLELGSVSTKVYRWIARGTAVVVPVAVGVVLALIEKLDQIPAIGGGVGVAAVLLTSLWILQMRKSRSRLLRSQRMARRADVLAMRRRDVLSQRLKSAERAARQKREDEQAGARKFLADQVERSGPRMDRRLEKLESRRTQVQTTAKDELESAQTESARIIESARTSSKQTKAECLQASHTHHRKGTDQANETLRQGLDGLHSHWSSGQASLAELQSSIEAMDETCGPLWSDPAWSDRPMAETFDGDVRVATMQFDAPAVGGGLPDDASLAWTGPSTIDLPLSLNFGDLGALRIEHDAASRTHALETLRSILLRTVTTIPPGRLRLVLCDPVGLGQEFAGFMHLADHEEADVLDRIWTEAAHIEQRLTDLTEHMENVIQTYLRNEYDSIEEYNAQAGEIAEPYRLLVLADFPEGLSERSVHRLESIIASGRRCGVFTMILRDTARPLPEGLSETALNTGALRLQCAQGTWSLQHPQLPPMPVSVEPPPDDDCLTMIVERVGEAAAGSRRVEVSFDFVAPSPEEVWSRSTANELRVPIGQSGATRRLELRLGRGTMQHALVAGKTGSGKSTLLHVLITNLSQWCSPDEVEFYLVDFKKGVEFQAYSNRDLPHARVIAIESDREFGLSVLRRLDVELRTRGEKFRDLGVQDIAGFREISDEPMPRVLLIIDEFQEFFVDDDPVAQEASLLLDRLVRQGRAFGMHAILGSQTLDGAYSLARSTLGQMGVRIALQCSEGDSYLILSDDNPAARLLGRPGEAIYNDAGGRIEGNTPFQIVWLDDARRDGILADALQRDGGTRREQFVFKGHVPASLPDDRLVRDALAGQAPPLPDGGLLPLRLGEPVAIRESTDLTLRPQAGGNALLVGQHPEAATAVLTGAMLQAALRLAPAPSLNDPGLQIWLIDGQSPDAMLAGRLASFAAALPHQVTRVTARNVEPAMQALADTLSNRADGRREGRATVLIVGVDVHRIRDLRAHEDDFSFSMDDDDDRGPRPDKVLADVLREGPSVGMHALLWFDAAANLSRTLDRNAQREFEQKVLFQMSANDSGQLIDSTAASDLGLHRGLLYVEDTGTLEKFRPWALPDPQWLEQAAATIKRLWGSENAAPDPH
ncbi:MAG: hypothetical protein MK101_03635 [Phycisphaerales bacterium]|nr:hypothetical protein [Phycisphaerales bacterium]